MGRMRSLLIPGVDKKLLVRDVVKAMPDLTRRRFIASGASLGALTFKLAHDDLSKYNQVQKLLYTGIIIVGVVIVLSGLSIWKPVQLQWLTALFGGYDIARYVHFVCMSLIVAFLVIHVALALLVPKSLRAMIIGR